MLMKLDLNIRYMREALLNRFSRSEVRGQGQHKDTLLCILLFDGVKTNMFIRIRISYSPDGSISCVQCLTANGCCIAYTYTGWLKKSKLLYCDNSLLF